MAVSVFLPEMVKVCSFLGLSKRVKKERDMGWPWVSKRKMSAVEQERDTFKEVCLKLESELAKQEKERIEHYQIRVVARSETERSKDGQMLLGCVDALEGVRIDCKDGCVEIDILNAFQSVKEGHNKADEEDGGGS